jgi:hypothetical protein
MDGDDLDDSNLPDANSINSDDDAEDIPVVYGLSQPSTPSMASPIPSALINATIHETIKKILPTCQLK